VSDNLKNNDEKKIDAPVKKSRAKKPTVFDVEEVKETTEVKVEEKPVVKKAPAAVVKQVAELTKGTVKEESSNETKKPRKRKEVQNDIVDVVIEKSKLPVYEENLTAKAFMSIDENKTEKDPKKSLKKLDEESREKAIEQKLLEDNTASYVQIIKDKKQTKKVIRYNTNTEKGLPNEIVEHRKFQGLVNDNPVGSTKTIPAIIFSNIFTFFNLLNFAIAGWLIATFGIDAWKYVFFIAIVTANLVISIVQEIRSKKVIDKLSILSSPSATVLRDSDVFEVPVNEVVLDDILCLSNGNQIASDSILVDGGIEVNESLLTGESDAISKKPGDVLYSGSFVVSGNCKARVERIGKDNYIEKLTNQAKKYRKPKSDLLKTLTMIIRVVAIIIIPLGTMVFFSQWNGVDWGGSYTYAEAVRTTAGAVIGMIPSGLFLLTSVALAVGVIRLAQNNTLVQELYCIEMLARVDVLCLDKTGTITDGSMAVKSVIEYPNDSGVTVKNAYSAMQNALNDNNVTSRALEEKFGRAKRIKHCEIIPFSSARKYSAVEFERYGTFVLGAPEFVLTKNYGLVAADVNKAANGGYRVICLAHSSGSIVDGHIEGNILPVALILIEDTIRPDAVETIAYFKQSGVDVKVISGDNPLTVSKISERAGIENADQYISLDGLSDKEVIRAADKYTVFGRVSPAQKKLLVMTLKGLGKTVAMTGDGVNDILALKEADCSIALASGSEAARNVSHLVLLDSNFGSMPKVVAEGRRVINNVQRVASLFLTKTIFSFLLAVYCIIIKKYPISTNQLFLIDMFVTGIPSFILALESNNNKVRGKFFINVLKNALPGALVIAFTTALVFFLSNKIGLTDIEVTTIIVLNATFTCFTVLYKVCRPFNVIRRALFFIMAFCATLLAVVVPNMFEIAQVIPISFSHLPSDWPIMNVNGILLLLCLMQATYPAIKFVENIKYWIKNLVSYFVNTLRKIK
jgi:cation-transporting ATPase E